MDISHGKGLPCRKKCPGVNSHSGPYPRDPPGFATMAEYESRINKELQAERKKMLAFERYQKKKNDAALQQLVTFVEYVPTATCRNMKQLASGKSKSLSLMPAMGSFDAVGSSRQSVSRKRKQKTMELLLVVPESLVTMAEDLSLENISGNISS